MPAQALLIEVGLLDDRWHGVGDWPPSPFRLFQALVAGAYGGRWAAEDSAEKDAAFRWLERLTPPAIAAPPRTLARTVTHFVPNNDLDSVGGDPRRIGEIRSAKEVRPSLFESADSTFRYVWTFEADGDAAEPLCTYAERLHAFGRGVDAAYARAAVMSPDEADSALSAHGGTISRPSGSGAAGGGAPCPTSGSLDSLKARHAATAARFETVGQGRKREVLFHQPPKAQYRPVPYDSPPTRLIYALRRADAPAVYHPVSQTEALSLTEAVRDGAAARLTRSARELGPCVERFLVGRGAEAADAARRVRIFALPTLGHPHASPAIRRVLVEVPPDCPLRVRDLAWAFGGLDPDEVSDPETGEVLKSGPVVLSPADADGVTEHYGLGAEPARRWRSVTPVALPRAPGHSRTGGERARSEAQATAQVAAALRHAGVAAKPVEVRIQREPFHARGEGVDAFERAICGATERVGERPAQAERTHGSKSGRFAGRLRHVEVLFDRPVFGPLAIGDGRFLGLGLMRQVRTPTPGLHVFAVDPSSAPPLATLEAVLRALRRAVMSSVQRTLKPGVVLPPLFHGHDEAGRPARSGRHEHLFYAAWSSDGGERLDRLAIVSPHLVDRSNWRAPDDLAKLPEALVELRTLRAGRAGLLLLTQLEGTDPAEPPLAAGRVWTSVTPYRPTRHPGRTQDAASAVADDLQAECARRGLPRPEVETLELEQGPRGGLTAHLRLRFAVEVDGPVLLGRASHFGAGLFQPSVEWAIAHPR